VEKWRAASTQGEPFEAEAQVRRADGSYRWFSSRAVPYAKPRKEISRLYGTTSTSKTLKRAQEKSRNESR